MADHRLKKRIERGRADCEAFQRWAVHNPHHDLSQRTEAACRQVRTSLTMTQQEKALALLTIFENAHIQQLEIEQQQRLAAPPTRQLTRLQRATLERVDAARPTADAQAGPVQSGGGHHRGVVDLGGNLRALKTTTNLLSRPSEMEGGFFVCR
jgi:hypothetical protein